MINEESDVDVQLNNRHMMIRGENMSKILRARSVITRCFRDHFFERGYCEVCGWASSDLQSSPFFFGILPGYLGLPAVLLGCHSRTQCMDGVGEGLSLQLLGNHKLLAPKPQSLPACYIPILCTNLCSSRPLHVAFLFFRCNCCAHVPLASNRSLRPRWCRRKWKAVLRSSNWTTLGRRHF